MAGSSQPQHFFAAGCVFDDLQSLTENDQANYYIYYTGVATLRYQI